MRRSSEALQLGNEFGSFANELDLPGALDEYGERMIDIEDLEPRDRVAEAQSYLEQTMVKARQLVSSTPTVEGEDLFPTRNPAIDQLLAGGIGRGEMIEAVGWRSSGRFSLVLSLLAAATQAGESAALVDLGDHLDPEAARQAGVDLERLLWMRPEHIKQALGCAEMVIGAGFSLVVLDLGTPPVAGGRGAEAAWLRLQRATLTNRCALFISAPYRASGTAAHAVLELHRGAGGWITSRPLLEARASARSANVESPRLLGGLLGTAELAKMRLGRLKQAAQLGRTSQLRTSGIKTSQVRTSQIRANQSVTRIERTQTEAVIDKPRLPTSSQVVPLAQHKRRSTPRTSQPASQATPQTGDAPESTSKTNTEKTAQSRQSSQSSQSSKSASDVALQLAVRFALRSFSGSVAELAAPLTAQGARTNRARNRFEPRRLEQQTLRKEVQLEETWCTNEHHQHDQKDSRRAG